MSVRNADWFMTISRGQAIKGMRHLQDPSKRGRSLGSAQTAHVHFAGMLPLKRGAFSLIHWSTFGNFQMSGFQMSPLRAISQLRLSWRRSL